ncbi:putative sporulation protein YtxC [Scopulibacillus daqui]|uniref:Sporulation protein YtxC n=1 Tax=Scopulibacillus daqui TaxID=1469162 RepID=A0ABS2PXK4_9BACL|nr:putative sporulation protein YtxC [Scopulibacillus daqui]MBM7644778.1 putative sporulation protein YtxC [Scopulibacillus daqui]
MISVTFESRHEAVSLNTHIAEAIKEPLHFQIHKETLTIGLKGDALSIDFRKKLIDVFVEFIIDTYEKKWLLDIISSTFYFKDKHDQEEILEIVQSIFDGERTDLPRLDILPSRHQILKEAIHDIFEDKKSLSFQSIIRFRLHKYRTCLQKYVELAIDEYKLQQEYQAFVDKLRRIVRAYRPLHHTIYVIDDQPFKLLDENYQYIKNVQSIRSFYPLLKQWGIEAEPSILLTLIGLAPKNIFIYTDRPEYGMMQTLQNVFEERVTFLPKSTAATINK